MMPLRVYSRSMGAALCAAAAGFAACTKAPADAAAGGDKATVSAQTIVLVKQPFTETLGAIGSVNARSGHSASLSAPALGRISRVLVTTGQVVGAGDVLVELEQAPFVSAAQSAQAALAAAERAYERQKRLADEGIVPRKDAEQAAAELARARSDAVAAQRISDQSTLRAPISGVVTRMNAMLGGSADPSQVLVEIADPNALDILFNVTPSDAGRIRRGARVTLSAGQDANGEPLGIGAVVDIAGTVDSLSRSVAVRTQAPATRRPLRIGETVFGTIAIATNPSAIVIPTEALVPEGEGFKVFVVDATGIAHEREVTVGGKTDKMVEITAGLTAGERIATRGAYGLEDSVKVIPMKPPVTP